MSHFAHGLFLLFDSVLAMDVDEFLVVDLLVGRTLSEYLEGKQGKHATLSGLGLDVGQHMIKESDIDLIKPFLSQRSYANINSRYTKPIVAYRPVTWGSGMHKVKEKTIISMKTYICFILEYLTTKLLLSNKAARAFSIKVGKGTSKEEESCLT